MQALNASSLVNRKALSLVYDKHVGPSLQVTVWLDIWKIEIET